MKKINLLIVFQIVFSMTVYSQNNLFGNITYNFTLNLKGIPLEREATLEFYDEKSIFYHSRGDGIVMVDRDGNKGDINMSVTTVNDNSGKAVLDFYNQDSTGNTYYFDSRKDSLQVRELVFLRAVLYDEKIPKIKWKILNEKKKIENFSCLKAIADFRGRKYTVWFTPEIPLSYGPWKLTGLPGLILEASDEYKEVVFSAKKIYISSTCQKGNKIYPPKDGEKISFEKAKTMYIDEQRKLISKAKSGLNRDQEFDGMIELNLLEKFEKDE